MTISLHDSNNEFVLLKKQNYHELYGCFLFSKKHFYNFITGGGIILSTHILDLNVNVLSGISGKKEPYLVR